MAYDANSALLYVGTADYETQYPNSVVAINPVTAAIATIQAVGANPDLLSVGAGGLFVSGLRKRHRGNSGTTSFSQQSGSLGSRDLWTPKHIGPGTW